MSNPCIEPIPLKNLTYNNGVLWTVSTKDEEERMNSIKNIQYAVVGKFAYGLTKLNELQIE